MQLYIHIGCPKTGSTSIQASIEQEREQLESMGVAVPDWLNYRDKWGLAAYCGYPGNVHYYTKILSAFTEKDFDDYINTFRGTWESTLNDIVKSKNYHSMLISSEYLYSLCSQPQSIKCLYELVNPYFSGVKIIFYFRDQVSFIKSTYSQLVKGPALSSISFHDYISTISQSGIYDYYHTLENWSHYFGKSNILVGEVGPGALTGDKLIADYYEKIGLGKGFEFEELKENKQNKSPGYQNLVLMRLVNKFSGSSVLDLKYNDPKRRALHYLAKITPARTRFPDKYDANIKELYRVSNQKLREEYSS